VERFFCGFGGAWISASDSNQLKEKLDNHSADQTPALPPNITYKIQELHVDELNNYRLKPVGFLGG